MSNFTGSIQNIWLLVFYLFRLNCIEYYYQPVIGISQNFFNAASLNLEISVYRSEVSLYRFVLITHATLFGAITLFAYCFTELGDTTV